MTAGVSGYDSAPGSVMFSDGAAVLGTAPLSGGAATFTVSNWPWVPTP